MPPKPSTRKGVKKGMSHALSPHLSSSPIRNKQKRIHSAILERANKSSLSEMPKTEPSTGTHSPSEYWNQLTDLQLAFFDDATQFRVSNPYVFGTEIKAEVSSPTPAFFANDGNESEYNFDMTPVSGPISYLLPYTEDYFTLCHAPTADATGYPIFVSRNGRWDWFYLTTRLQSLPLSPPMIQRT